MESGQQAPGGHFCSLAFIIASETLGLKVSSLVLPAVLSTAHGLNKSPLGIRENLTYRG